MEYLIKHSDFLISIKLPNDILSLSTDGMFEKLSANDKDIVSNYEYDIWETAKTYNFFDLRRGILEELLSCILNYKLTNTNKFLYFLEAENGLIKVGISNDVMRRIKSLEYQLKTKIRLIKCIENKSYYEKAIHKMFENDNIIYQGQTEWFHPTHELIKFVSEIDEKNIDFLCQER